MYSSFYYFKLDVIMDTPSFRNKEGKLIKWLFENYIYRFHKRFTEYGYDYE